jgi:hypothetical protein
VGCYDCHRDVSRLVVAHCTLYVVCTTAESNDATPQAMAELLTKKPEGEARLLAALINKLGKPGRVRCSCTHRQAKCAKLKLCRNLFCWTIGVILAVVVDIGGRTHCAHHCCTTLPLQPLRWLS